MGMLCFPNEYAPNTISDPIEFVKPNLANSGQTSCDDSVDASREATSHPSEDGRISRNASAALAVSESEDGSDGTNPSRDSMAIGDARQVLRSRISGSGRSRRCGTDGEAGAIPSNCEINVVQSKERKATARRRGKYSARGLPARDKAEGAGQTVRQVRFQAITNLA